MFRFFFVLTIAGVFLATSYGASEPEKKVSPKLIFFLFQVFVAFTANNFYVYRVSPRNDPIVIQHHLY